MLLIEAGWTSRERRLFDSASQHQRYTDIELDLRLK